MSSEEEQDAIARRTLAKITVEGANKAWTFGRNLTVTIISAASVLFIGFSYNQAQKDQFRLLHEEDAALWKYAKTELEYKEDQNTTFRYNQVNLFRRVTNAEWMLFPNDRTKVGREQPFSMEEVTGQRPRAKTEPFLAPEKP